MKLFLTILTWPQEPTKANVTINSAFPAASALALSVMVHDAIKHSKS